MKRKMVYIMISVLAMIMISSCSNAQPEVVKDLNFNNNSAKFVYDSNVWQEFDSTGGTVVKIKSEKKAVAIGAERIPSTDNESEYVEKFKAVMEKLSLDGTCKVDKLNNFPLLTYTEKKDNSDITFSVLVFKDGEGYYEVNFICVSDLYDKYKDEAFEVMKTFKIVNPTKDNVIVDPKLSEGIETLDVMAGYDEAAVKKNISPDGSELIGVWKYENNTKYGRTYEADGTFKENYNVDNTSYLEGTWKYDSNTSIITHKATKLMENEKDITSKMNNKTLQFQIKNFDGKKMYGISLESTKLRTLIR